ncbi:MAG: DUF4349 domain-containing protein [archaeon]|nr:DUF4349 domain-containing protein [Nanoarchaeota archaeon]
MGFKDQFKKIKENWLIVLVVLVLFLVPTFLNVTSTGVLSKSYGGYDYAVAEMAVEDVQYARSGGYYYPDESFAPEVEERLITKTGNLYTEIERGEFSEASDSLKSLINVADGYILNENVNRYGEGIASYYYGYYTIKVEAGEYDDLVVQLKELGEVTSFSESARDITESYLDLEQSLATEQARLARYEEMYTETNDISDKIDLTDKIFDIERTIAYYEEALENKDAQVSYSTIYFGMQEEQSSYANIALIGLGDLVRSLISSVNDVLSLLFWVIPWAIIALLVWFVVKRVRKNKSKKK